MKMYIIILFTIIFSDSLKEVNSLNILAVLPYQGRTHFIVFKPYLEELAHRGHNVTVISSFPRKSPLENYHDISLDESKKLEYFMYMIEPSYSSRLQVINSVLRIGLDNCKTLLADKKVQLLWKAQANFDLVVVEQFNTDCPLALAYKLGAPVIGISTTAVMHHYFSRFGIPQNPSFVSNVLLNGGTRPTLYQRTERAIFNLFAPLIQSITRMLSEYVISQYLDDIPSLEELACDIKILLVYQYFILGGSIIRPANVIEVGGFHITNPKPLPEDLKRFIEESEHGIIYVSFGTNLHIGTMDNKYLEAILSALSSVPQRIIWKWDEDLLPINSTKFYLAKWLPQNDILAHSNVLAFFSHCGNLGLQEALYHGVPVLGMAFFGDHPGNGAAMEESGLGIRLDLSELTKENFLRKLNIILKPEFRKNVMILSKAWRNRPISPMDSAIFWTEFAAQYPNITYRTRAADVPFYQYLCLDVLIILVLFISTAFYAMKLFLFLCFSKKNILVSDKKNTKPKKE